MIPSPKSCSAALEVAETAPDARFRRGSRSREPGAVIHRGLMRCRLHYPKGFVLLEILMAIALFSTVSVAMVQALGQIGDTSVSTRREAMMVRRLESAITEAANRPKLESVRWEQAADGFGISVITEVEEADLQNREGKTLEGVWHVRVEVMWTDGVRREVRQTETYVNETLSDSGAAE